MPTFFADPKRHGAQWSPVDSSCISEFCYYADRAKGGYILSLRYRESGRVYDYRGVPPSVYARLISAPSRGKFINAEIKPNYPCSPG